MRLCGRDCSTSQESTVPKASDRSQTSDFRSQTAERETSDVKCFPLPCTWIRGWCVVGLVSGLGGAGFSAVRSVTRIVKTGRERCVVRCEAIGSKRPPQSGPAGLPAPPVGEPFRAHRHAPPWIEVVKGKPGGEAISSLEARRSRAISKQSDLEASVSERSRASGPGRGQTHESPLGRGLSEENGDRRPGGRFALEDSGRRRARKPSTRSTRGDQGRGWS